MARARPVYSDTIGRELCRIGGKLFEEKGAWDQLCQELAEILYPMRADFTQQMQLGDDFAIDLMDSYPSMARAQLADAIEAMLRQGEWFQVSTGDDDRDKTPANARALARITSIIRNMIADRRTHFKSAMKEADHDWVTFGNAPTSWQESADRSFAFLKAHHPRDVAFMVNGDQVVDVIHRKLMMSARDIMARVDSGRWKGTPHPDVTKAAKDDPGHEFELRHCLMPTDDMYGSDKAMRRSIGQPFTSIYYDVEHEMTFSTKGSRFFNYQVSRYRTLGTWPWGFSPVALQTLPDGRMAQALAGMFLEQGEKALDPPIVGAGDVFRNDFNLYSGGFTMVELAEGQKLQDAMTVIDTSKNMPVGFEMKQDLRNMIAEGFLLNKLVIPNTREMTAYETGIRLDEYRRAALPFFSPIEEEHHAPILSNALEMAMNLGMILPEELPPDLHGQEIVFRFTSPLNEAEGQKTAAAFRQVVADVASILELDPSAKTRVNWGPALNDAIRGDGADPSWMPTDEELKAMSEQSKQLTDAATAGQTLGAGANVAASVATASQGLQMAGLGTQPQLALPAPAA